MGNNDITPYRNIQPPVTGKQKMEKPTLHTTEFPQQKYAQKLTELCEYCIMTDEAAARFGTMYKQFQNDSTQTYGYLSKEQKMLVSP